MSLFSIVPFFIAHRKGKEKRTEGILSKMEGTCIPHVFDQKIKIKKTRTRVHRNTRYVQTCHFKKLFSTETLKPEIVQNTVLSGNQEPGTSRNQEHQCVNDVQHPHANG
jgi:hypothetical protein